MLEELKIKEDYSIFKDKIVLKDRQNELTYGQLICYAMRIGLWLRERNMVNQSVVIEAAHNVYTVGMILGVLLSGNYYVPIAEDIPQERKDKIIQETKTQIVISSSFLSEQGITADMNDEVFENENNWSRLSIADDKEEKSDLCVSDNQKILNIIFTSGSTGEPKGIIKSQSAMLSFEQKYIEKFGFDSSDVIANQSPFYFDASAKDIFTMLILKCKLLIIDKQEFFPAAALVEKLNAEKVTRIQWVPSALMMCSAVNVFATIKPKYLKSVMFVGEKMPKKHLIVWQKALPEVSFINTYGASETAGVCITAQIEDCEGEGIPIGYPMPGCEVLLVDENGVKVEEEGRCGEICVKSDFVFSGYVGDIDGNKYRQKMLDGSCYGKTGLFYKTGDIGCYGKNGEIFCVDRNDNQIKHMGYRIELTEIEEAAEDIEGVSRSCCSYINDRIILAYSGDIQDRELKVQLKQKLPAYMQPSKCVYMEVVPLNRNGKLDRPEITKKLIDIIKRK